MQETSTLDMKLAISRSGIGAKVEYGLSREEPGFLAYSKDGSSFVDMRLNSVLERAFKEVRKEMLDALFSE